MLDKQTIEIIKSDCDYGRDYVYPYKAEGYKCWVLIFEKKNGLYCVTDHLSTESGYEEDLDYFETPDFDKVLEYIKDYE